jgi:glutaminyl-tRNA synthetase
MAIYDAEVKKLDPALAHEEPKAPAKGEGKAEATDELKAAAKKEEEEDEKALLIKYKTEKFMARDLSWSLNDPEILEAHQQRTGNKVVTRFPPEPNGYLHIGHCKAIRFSFKVAQDYDGYTYLRYDDTNPEAETQEYIDTIKDTVHWLGYTPKYITYASDNFEKIYEVAIRLIKLGKAYVCKLSKEEAKKFREEGRPSPFRNTPPEVNLREFQLMKDGFYAEKEVCLRAKIDYLNPNPTLRDPTIYRIKYVPHPHLGSKWCIYPLYDFVHSLCDSFEDITHSLCTLEFEGRRELYYWSLDQLNMYKPFVWEYSRLNITNNVLSKRKLVEMINKKMVDGWDDPRLFTVVGLRRRGYPAEAINNFCDMISVTRRGNDNVLQYSFLEHCIRQYLLDHAPKTFAVVEPAILELVNEEGVRSVEEKDLFHPLFVGKKVYVERSDVRLVDSKDFYGIAPGKMVRLRYGPFVRIHSVEEDGQGSFRVKGETVPSEQVENPKKVKGILHFVEKEHSVTAEVREYDRLFNAEFPGEKTGNFLDDFNHDSKKIHQNAKIWKDHAAKLVKEGKYQFERLGFFSVDYDSDLGAKKYVFNKTVGLKESEKTREIKAAK